MLLRIVRACSLPVLLASAALAQTSTGGVSGTVRDASGAVAPQAQLTLTNLETNERREQKSDERGLFSFTALQPARYRLEAAREGFKTFALEPIEVRVQLFVSVQPAINEIGSYVFHVRPLAGGVGDHQRNVVRPQQANESRNFEAFVPHFQRMSNLSISIRLEKRAYL